MERREEAKFEIVMKYPLIVLFFFPLGLYCAGCFVYMCVHHHRGDQKVSLRYDGPSVSCHCWTHEREIIASYYVPCMTQPQL